MYKEKYYWHVVPGFVVFLAVAGFVTVKTQYNLISKLIGYEFIHSWLLVIYIYSFI